MSEDAAPREPREKQSSSGFWLIVVFVLLPLLYILSPPWVAMLLGPAYYEQEVFKVLYAPLIAVANQITAVDAFYEWYFELIDVI